ncbi:MULTISPECIES: hypothetical protein [unclassified Aeromicrobium]|uniref:hypothetical protein n=1 Tax=unclassified Aeromicrobium TaxID=2633570 RepID=UPI00288B5869|nr:MULTISPECIES: hypothetical protein [unclassified Aeromicrobium]
MTATHIATVYAVVRAERRRYGTAHPDTGLRPVDSIKVERVTQTYPRTVHPNTVVVKLQLQVPDSAFAPLLPNAVIAVPESMIDQPVHVEAVTPSEDGR